jgi:hypothetical protein
MALYELVLRDRGREEARYTDVDPGAEGYVVIRGERWNVAAVEENNDEDIDRRYILERDRPTSGGC